MDDKLNAILLAEIIFSKKQDRFTETLSELVLDTIKREIDRNRYKFILEEYRVDFIAFAYSICNRHLLNFNPDKTERALPYLRIIIQSSFANTIGKRKKELGLKTVKS